MLRVIFVTKRLVKVTDARSMRLQAQTAELRTAVAGLQETATAMNTDLLRKTLSELKDSVATFKARVLAHITCV